MWVKPLRHALLTFPSSLLLMRPFFPTWEVLLRSGLARPVMASIKLTALALCPSPTLSLLRHLMRIALGCLMLTAANISMTLLLPLLSRCLARALTLLLEDLKLQALLFLILEPKPNHHPLMFMRLLDGPYLHGPVTPTFAKVLLVFMDRQGLIITVVPWTVRSLPSVHLPLMMTPPLAFSHLALLLVDPTLLRVRKFIFLSLTYLRGSLDTASLPLFAAELMLSPDLLRLFSRLLPTLSFTHCTFRVESMKLAFGDLMLSIGTRFAHTQKLTYLLSKIMLPRLLLRALCHGRSPSTMMPPRLTALPLVRISHLDFCTKNNFAS